jgi:hypothetical protein
MHVLVHTLSPGKSISHQLCAENPTAKCWQAQVDSDTEEEIPSMRMQMINLPLNEREGGGTNDNATLSGTQVNNVS